MEQDLIRDVRCVIEDDLLEDLLISLRTSATGVTEGYVSNGVPVNGRSGILVE